MTDISVLVIDDHVIFAQAVQSLLTREPDLRPVWIADTFAEARALIARYRPSVVLLDLMRADCGALQVVHHASEHSPKSRLLVLTGGTSTESVVASLRLGVRGWLPKTVDSDHLVRAIRGVARGEVWLAPDLLSVVLPELLQTAAVPDSPLTGLTAREREVLQCLVDGLTRAKIAERLYLSTNTVRTHAQNVMAKLNVHATLEAVAVAMQHGLTPKPVHGPDGARVREASEGAQEQRNPPPRQARPRRRRGITQIA